MVLSGDLEDAPSPTEIACKQPVSSLGMEQRHPGETLVTDTKLWLLSCLQQPERGQGLGGNCGQLCETG
jgi:hypothetical protein